MSKLITVFGATGKQGGAVVNAILADAELSKEFKVRAVTRSPSKPVAQELAKKGVEVVSGDMDSTSSVESAVEGAHTVFSVTNFWESVSAETEYAQGKAVADASKKAGVAHLIFSSLINVSEATAGRLTKMKHFDTKADVERYIRQIGLPATFILPGYFASNYLQMFKRGDEGGFVFSSPVTDEALFPVVDIEKDFGRWVIAAIRNRETLLGKRILAAVDYYTPQRLVEEFTQVTGHPAKFVRTPDEQFLSYLPPNVGPELLENHQLLDSPGYYAGADLAESAALLDPKPTSWKEFVARVPEWK